MELARQLLREQVQALERVQDLGPVPHSAQEQVLQLPLVQALLSLFLLEPVPA